MDIFDLLSLVCGLALFLYGMEAMGDGLKKSAGSSLKTILGKMTSNPFKGFLLGLGVTMIIQSSSATTVMVVGFVNSGTMTLLQAVGVILGANVGTAITAWITGLSGLGAGGEAAVSIIKWFKPDSWMPIVALIGICIIMFAKNNRKKEIGTIMMGFSVLMVGMSMMSDSVSGLAQDEGFRSFLVMFENPILGVMAGLILTAIVQSSSASVGILQSLTVTGAISYGAAIPIIMGQNIGTCVTALLSSLSANHNGKRAAMVHLYFNIIAVVVVLSGFYALDAMLDFALLDWKIDMWGVAAVHTIFKIIAVAVIGPFYKQLAKLATLTVPAKKDVPDDSNLLDERLIDTPVLAIARATEVSGMMAELSTDALLKSFALLENYDAKTAEEIRALESRIDGLEDMLGSYLVKVSAQSLDEKDSAQLTKLLHIIGDYERISDHSVNIVEAAEEMREKKIEFSEKAKAEVEQARLALTDVLNLTKAAFVDGDLGKAVEVEPLEQVIDEIVARMKRHHILRLQRGECTIELGFVLNDLLVCFERVSDHCSNIASCVVEVSEYGAMDMHKYLDGVRHDSNEFKQMYKEKRFKYLNK